MSRSKGPCPVCGTSQTKRRTKEEVAGLDDALYWLARQNRPVTIRQMFYLAEVKGLVPKCEKHGYGPVQRRLLALREDGRMPHGWITDNARMVRRQSRWSDPDGFLSEVAAHYRRDYWSESDVQVEIWLEKDALAGVLYPVVVNEFGLALHVTRGFSSITYLQEAADDIKADGRETYVYVLTDFDPSGISIYDTIQRELWKRTITYKKERERYFDQYAAQLGEEKARKVFKYMPESFREADVHVQRLAVDRHQIDEYQLPTRPTKKSDTRARAFIEEHGTDSVELDAIPPSTLRQLVRASIEKHMDPYRLQFLKEQEERERRDLTQLAESMR